jgi:hypothetical protein
MHRISSASRESGKYRHIKVQARFGEAIGADSSRQEFERRPEERNLGRADKLRGLRGPAFQNSERIKVGGAGGAYVDTTAIARTRSAGTAARRATGIAAIFHISGSVEQAALGANLSALFGRYFIRSWRAGLGMLEDISVTHKVRWVLHSEVSPLTGWTGWTIYGTA